MTTSDQGPARGRSMRGQIRRHGLFVFAWIAVLFPLFFIVPESHRGIVALVCFGVAMPFAAALQFNVRCPRCGTRLLLRFVKGTHSHSPFTQVRCHQCGLPAYQPAEFDPSYS